MQKTKKHEANPGSGFSLPMDDKYLQKLSFKSGSTNTKEGTFLKGNFTLDNLGDTYLDMRKYKSGFVVVNGHNLGRYWIRGPQKRLYCPAPWLKKRRMKLSFLIWRVLLHLR